MDHADLVAEFPRIEKLTPQERLRLAKERRAIQLRKYLQLEKEQEGRKKSVNQIKKQKKRNIRFSDTIQLLEASARNDLEEVKRLLERGVDPNSKNEDGLTALHQSCIDNNEEMLLLLIRSRADVNSEDSEKWTPLHAAATCGHKRLVDILLRKGANLLAVNSDGNMPYDICDDEGTYYFIETEMAKRGITQEIINETRAAPEQRMLADLKEIKAKGGSLEVINGIGATPLHVAAANGYVKVAEFLLENDVSTECRDVDGWQPVHSATCWGHLDVLELLVQHGASLNALTTSGESPYDICEDKEMRERIDQLRREFETRVTKEPAIKAPRRSSSTVRRTSIHKKNMTPKKDAMNEGLMNRLRVEQSTESNNTIQQQSSDNLDSPSDDVAPIFFPILKRDTLGEVKFTEKDQERLRQAADSEARKERQSSQHNSNKGRDSKENRDVKVMVDSTDGSNNTTIDIRIQVAVGNNENRRSTEFSDSYRSNSVYSNPKTLTDLKTERRRSRTQSFDADQTTVQTVFTQSRTETYGRSRSPSSDYMKFAGEPLEVVGGDAKGRKCCIVM